MKAPQLVSTLGELTPDGQRWVAFVESYFVEADKMNNIDHLNGMPGVIKDYYARVFKMGHLTPVEYLREFPNAAQGVWEIHEYVKAQLEESETVKETADKTNGLAAELEKLQASVNKELAKLRKENQKLREQVDALTAPAENETENQEEPEAEAEDDASDEATDEQTSDQGGEEPDADGESED